MITFAAEQLNSLSPELLAQIILEQQRQITVKPLVEASSQRLVRNLIPALFF